MLMSPTVNADTPASQCATQGYVAGFFDAGDFDGPSDPNSNQGEIFYSIVPDSLGQFSCQHTVGDVGFDVPSTFMHELQHLINYSQHVIVSGGEQSSSWLDEGMSIVAEELGSVYYEKKCPPPQCRSDPSQIFPDSSQGFVQDFLDDSYDYAYLPDTSTITLSTDDEGGFSWRGGAWLFARWLGDQMGSTVFRQLERGPSNALTDVQQVTGQTFPALFAQLRNCAQYRQPAGLAPQHGAGGEPLRQPQHEAAVGTRVRDGRTAGISAAESGAAVSDNVRHVAIHSAAGHDDVQPARHGNCGDGHDSILRAGRRAVFAAAACADRRLSTTAGAVTP